MFVRGKIVSLLGVKRVVLKRNLCIFFFAPWKFFWILANSWYMQYKRSTKNLKEFSRGKKESTKVFKKIRIARFAHNVIKRDFFLIFKHCAWSFSNLSVRSIKRDIFGIFLAPLHLEDEQLIQRFERSVAVKTFYLGSISDFAGRAASAARVQNPRLCNPIKVTGFISPDLTFSAPEDFMTLPMPILLFSSHYQRHALQPFFFHRTFFGFQIVIFTSNTHWKVFRVFHEILILLVYASG